MPEKYFLRNISENVNIYRLPVIFLNIYKRGRKIKYIFFADDPKKPDNADIVMELVATLGKAIEIGSSGVLSNDDKSMFTNHVGRVTNTFLLRKAQQQQTSII